jgi:2-hydroxychromene-2-carboxylate isomerase
MVNDLEFYFDVASPPSYIAHERLPALVERTGATLILRPVLVGGVFKLSGNAAPVSVRAKKAYMMQVELPRLARRYGIALDFDRRAPFGSLNLMRGAVVAEERGGLADYATAVFRATWAMGRDMSDPSAVADVLDAAGFDAEVIFARIQEPTIKGKLIAATEAAVARGVFGVPTFFIGTEMYFGQDHLDFIETALSAAAP